VYLDAPHSMSELVDTEDLKSLPGSSAPGWFMGWALSAPDGRQTSALAREWLAQMCDNTLYVDDYEPVLDALANARQPTVTAVSAAAMPIAIYDALKLELVDAKWTLWRRAAWLIDLQVKVTNMTPNRVVELTRCASRRFRHWLKSTRSCARSSTGISPPRSTAD
jgi:hypothetical protein